MASYWPIQLSKNENSQDLSSRKIGGAERARTADPLLAKQALSQLSYSPILRDKPSKLGVTIRAASSHNGGPR